MGNIIAALFIGIVAFWFLIIGIQLKRGQWLKLIAGNTFGSLPKDQAIKAGKVVSNICFGSEALFLLIGINIFFNVGGTLLIVISVFLTIFSFWYLIRYLIHWVQTGE